MRKRLLFPERRAGSVYDIDFQEEYRNGIRGLIFDIDNTLVSQDAKRTEQAETFLRGLAAEGFRIALVSNNRHGRVMEFSEGTGAVFVPAAAKPSRKGYRKAMSLMGTTEEDTLVVGDQLLTDIFGANRAGLKNILVSPLDENSDTGAIKLKRVIERMLLQKSDASAKKNLKKSGT